MEENRVIAMNNTSLVPENYTDIHEGIVELLGTARSASARTVNALMTLPTGKSDEGLLIRSRLASSGQRTERR